MQLCIETQLTAVQLNTMSDMQGFATETDLTRK